MPIMELFNAFKLCLYYNEFSKSMDQFDKKVQKKDARNAYIDMRKVSKSVSRIVNTIR